MLINILQNFDFAGTRYLKGQNVDIDTQVGNRWIADGKASLDTDNIQSPVDGAGSAVASSRTALAADSGAMLELAASVTYTLSDAVALPGGVTLMGPASGTAAIAVTGSATINGGTTSVTISAGQVYVALPRATNAAAFVVKGS